MRRLFLLAVGSCLMLFAAACGDAAPPRFNATDISGAGFGRSLGALADADGRRFALAAHEGSVVIVFFGYTSCPDVCPTTLARFAELKRTLGDDGKRLAVVLVSVDPERDTPERLGVYVRAFDPTFVGLSGDLPAVDAVASEFKVFFAKRKAGDPAAHGGGHDHGHGHGDDAYLIDHSAGAYVFDPAGRVRLYVRDDAPLAALAADVRTLLAGR